MRLKHWLGLGALALFGVAIWYWVVRPAPPSIPVAQAKQGSLRSIVGTNGQVEPLQMAEVRSEGSGRIEKVLVSQGDLVKQGQLLAQLSDPLSAGLAGEAEAALQAARGREAYLQEFGASALRRRELAGQLQEAQQRLANASRDVEAAQRLQNAQAATAQEVELEKRKQEQAAASLKAVEDQIAAMHDPSETGDVALSAARANAQKAAARQTAASARITSPIAGTLYDFSVKAGGWVQSGELLGKVGDASSVRVRVYVDEPELGRVKEGLPVVIQWDARPDAEWKGTIEQLPTRIQAFGTRQVGEVLCRIENPSGDLIAGANVNAEIISAERSAVLIVPKQSVRRRLGEEGVWKVVGSRLSWQPVKTGISSVTDIEILSGLSAGDTIALLVDRELSEGMEVQAVTAR